MPERRGFTRRNLFIGAGIAAATSATAGRDAAAEAGTPSPSDDPRRVTLPDTPHTRAYLALARD